MYKYIISILWYLITYSRYYMNLCAVLLIRSNGDLVWASPVSWTLRENWGSGCGLSAVTVWGSGVDELPVCPCWSWRGRERFSGSVWACPSSSSSPLSPDGPGSARLQSQPSSPPCWVFRPWVHHPAPHRLVAGLQEPVAPTEGSESPQEQQSALSHLQRASLSWDKSSLLLI